MGAPQKLHLTQGHPETVRRFNEIIDALWDHADISFLTGLRESRSGPRRSVTADAHPASSSRDVSQPLQVIPAPTTDNPARVRVVNGLPGGLLPAEMNLLDVILPDGTDNHCYLTALNGTSYVYAKVAVDGTSGLYTGANVYIVDSREEPDGTYVYLQIATLTWDGTAPAQIVSQDALGNYSLFVYSSADGTVLSPDWSSLTPGT